MATPIAASLGDLVTLAILAQISKFIYNLRSDPSLITPYISFPLILILVYGFVVLPFSAKVAKNCSFTKDLLHNGWKPVLSAMVISSLGGSILNNTIANFPKVRKIFLLPKETRLKSIQSPMTSQG